MSKEVYSAVDACLNRAKEGVRVCEDVLRFSLRLIDFSIRLKEIRHRIISASSIFNRELLCDSRDVDGDSQKFVDLGNEKKRESLGDVLLANLHRAIEAVRSLEELYKTFDQQNENPFQVIRFELYNFEKEIYPVIIKSVKIEKFSNALYAIVDSAFVQNDEYYLSSQKLISGGASILQLRMKNASKKEVLAIAREISSLCKKENVVFIVNDHPDIAMLVGADGVHIGQDDLPIDEVRKILPLHMLVGISTHSYEQAIEAEKHSPDYIAIGPIYDTKSKYGELLKGIGKEVISKVKEKVKIPIVAIGGIGTNRVKEVIDSGADTPVIVSHLYENGDIEKNCSSIVGLLAMENVQNEL